MDKDLEKYEAHCFYNVNKGGYVITLAKHISDSSVTLIKEINPPESEQVMINLEPLSDSGRIEILKRLARKFDTEGTNNGKA